MYEIVQKRSRKANENLPLPLIARQNNKNSFENLREFIVIKIVIVITFIRFIILRFLQFLIRVSNRNSLSLSSKSYSPEGKKKKNNIDHRFEREMVEGGNGTTILKHRGRLQNGKRSKPFTNRRKSAIR